MEIPILIMKGLELPINVMIILVLGMIILIVVVALVYGAYRPSIGSVDLTTAKNNACQMLVSLGCERTSPGYVLIPNFDANGDGEINEEDTLMSLCEEKYGIETDDESGCKTQVCGCVLTG